MNILRTYRWLLAALLLSSFFVSPSLAQTNNHIKYKRIVSLLPSVTEVLYALGLQENIVGVTSYCEFPPEAREKTNVGGFIDVNYETLYGLEPDLAILQINSDDQNKRINEMGIETIEVETRNVNGILESIDRIGLKLNREGQAKQIIDRINKKIEEVQEKIKDLPKPRVLVTYYRSVGEEIIREVYIAGNHTYYNELIEIAGGVNAYQGVDIVTSPIVTPEGLLSMNPDIIIELMSMINVTGLSSEVVLKDWELLSDLDAFKNKRIYIFNKSYSGLPGPRLDLAIADMAEFIHPEINWSQ